MWVCEAGDFDVVETNVGFGVDVCFFHRHVVPSDSIEGRVWRWMFDSWTAREVILCEYTTVHIHQS